MSSKTLSLFFSYKLMICSLEKKHKIYTGEFLEAFPEGPIQSELVQLKDR